MKVRATNPAPEANPGGCATCGVGVPDPPKGGGTSAERRNWAMSQVGRPMVNPEVRVTNPEPAGHGMARKFRPKKRWEDSRPGTHPGRFGNPEASAIAHSTVQGRSPWSSRLQANPPTLSARRPPPGPRILEACFNATTGRLVLPGDALDGLPVNLIGYASMASHPQQQFARVTSTAWDGIIYAPVCGTTLPAARPQKWLTPTPYLPHATPTRPGASKVGARRAVRRSRAAHNPAPPLSAGRGGQLDYANQYAVFGPGVQPYGGYGGVGYAPSAPGVPVAYPVAPPGVYMQGQRCLTATDCAPNEYCQEGACFPTPGQGGNVGVTQTTSIGGVPVGNPGGGWVLNYPTKRFAPARRAANPGTPMTQMTQSLAPPGFAVR